MRSAMEDVTCREIDFASVINELYVFSAHELKELIKDVGNYTAIKWTTHNGSSVQINVETFARNFPNHLTVKLKSSKRDEQLFRYLLCGFRLLHALYHLAPHNSKLEEVLLDENVSAKMIELICNMTPILGNIGNKVEVSNDLFLAHSALLACSLYILRGGIFSVWRELAHALDRHPKVDIFAREAFVALHIDIQFLQVKLSQYQNNESGMRSELAEISRLCQHCEASLQFLLSLCQQNVFRERIFINKEQCGEGGILFVSQAIMKLPLCEESYLMASVSRLKSNVLSILLHLSEVKSLRIFETGASSAGGITLAESTIFEVLKMLRIMFDGDLDELFTRLDKNYPRGLLQLNALRLTQRLSSDSYFRNFIILNFTQAIATILKVAHSEFLSTWCCAEREFFEEDVRLKFDCMEASGWVLGVFSSSDLPDSTFDVSHIPRASYAFERTSLMVKIIGNLARLTPTALEGVEHHPFINKFLQCLQVQHANGPQIDALITQNLNSLLHHAGSLIPRYLNMDAYHRLSWFIRQLEQIKTAQEKRNQEREEENRARKRKR